MSLLQPEPGSAFWEMGLPLLLSLKSRLYLASIWLSLPGTDLYVTGNMCLSMYTFYACVTTLQSIRHYSGLLVYYAPV